MASRKIINEFAGAVFSMNAKRMRDILSQNEITEEDLCALEGLSIPVPIYALTRCWELVLNDNWNKKVMPKIRAARRRNQEVKDLFVSQFNINFDSLVIPFKDFSEADFYKCDYNETTEECLGFWNIGNLYKNCREIDLLLYESAVKFDFERTEELLMQGANPLAYIYDEDQSTLPTDEKERENFLDIHGSQLLSLIEMEDSYLACQLQHYCLKYVEDYNYNAKDIRDLFGFTAHELMFELLLKYIKD